jgi:uncharacterized Zn-binding protein involved in type VI secretion
MPAVVRHGDRARKGGAVQVRQQLASSDGAPKVATVGELFACIKHPGPPEHVLMNGCWFNRVGGKPVAIAFVTKASCGCRIVTGSPVYACCKHLDAKAKRLAEREALIEGAREMAKQEWFPERLRGQVNAHADRLERLNRDVRGAEASLATYGGATDPRFTKGHGGAPEGMIRLNSEDFMEGLPKELQDAHLWDHEGSGLQSNLYYDELSGEYVLAFRGTELVTGDLRADAVQAFGFADEQYSRAMELADALRRNDAYLGATGPNQQQGFPNLRFTGHSLGGGLAAAAGTSSQTPFVTYNAAGVHEHTVPRYTEGRLGNADGHPIGTRYYTSKDPLTFMQTPEGSAGVHAQMLAGGPLSKAVAAFSLGRTGGRLPPALGSTVYELPNSANRNALDQQMDRSRDAGWLGGHGSATVVQGIEDQKDESERLLKLSARVGLFEHMKRGTGQRDADLAWVFDQPVWDSW